jgi:hypothetical protein
MEQLIANAAKNGQVGLFRRFEMMQQWQAAQPAGAPRPDGARPDGARMAEAMIGPDGLHMTDRGYFCLAANLADALAGNWWSQGYAVAAQRPPAARVAGLGSGAVAAVPFGAAP